MRRRLLNLLTALSLLLCVVAAAAWWRNRIGPPAFTLESPGTVRAMTPSELAVGGYRIEYWRWSFGRLSLAEYVAYLHYDDHRRNGNGVERFEITVPYWLAVVTTALVPACWAWFWLRTRLRQSVARLRAERGECPACGYDLRATPDKCPECSHVPDGR